MRPDLRLTQIGSKSEEWQSHGLLENTSICERLCILQACVLRNANSKVCPRLMIVDVCLKDVPAAHK